jgi:hypothetical protein
VATLVGLLEIARRPKKTPIAETSKDLHVKIEPAAVVNNNNNNDNNQKKQQRQYG